VSLFAESAQTDTRDLGQFSADECRSRGDAGNTKSGPAIVCSWRQAAGSLVQCIAGIAADRTVESFVTLDTNILAFRGRGDARSLL